MNNKNKKKYIKPYFVISMPIDKLGRGPVNEKDAHEVRYQIWDQLYVTVAEFYLKSEAEKAVKLLNSCDE